MVGEEELRSLKTGDIIELQRKGFFRCDVSYAPASSESREQPVILFHIPDGRASTANKNFPKEPKKVRVSSGKKIVELVTKNGAKTIKLS